MASDDKHRTPKPPPPRPFFQGPPEGSNYDQHLWTWVSTYTDALIPTDLLDEADDVKQEAYMQLTGRPTTRSERIGAVRNRIRRRTRDRARVRKREDELRYHTVQAFSPDILVEAEESCCQLRDILQAAGQAEQQEDLVQEALELFDEEGNIHMSTLGKRLGRQEKSVWAQWRRVLLRAATKMRQQLHG